MSRLAINVGAFPFLERAASLRPNVGASVQSLNPVKRVAMFVKYGRPEVNYPITPLFIMRRFRKLPKLLYFMAIAAKHPTSRCESQRQICGAWGTLGISGAGTVDNNYSPGDDGSGRCSGVGSGFCEDGKRHAEMGCILRAM